MLHLGFDFGIFFQLYIWYIWANSSIVPNLPLRYFRNHFVLQFHVQYHFERFDEIWSKMSWWTRYLPTMSQMYLVQVESITTPITSHSGGNSLLKYYGFLSPRNEMLLFFFFLFDTFRMSFDWDCCGNAAKKKKKVCSGVKFEFPWV